MSNDASMFPHYRDLPSLHNIPPYPSVNPLILPTSISSLPQYPNIDNHDTSGMEQHDANIMEQHNINNTSQHNPYYFSPEQILSFDELAIDTMCYVDINRLYESLLLIHQRGLIDIPTYTDYIKLKQVEQLVVNALYKDTENWRIMLSSFDKCHRVNQARLAYLKDQHDKRKY